MGETKRFYWLKLKEDFFRQKEIKKLRNLAGGDTFTIIYLKMLLRSLKDGGKLYYEGVEADFPGEVALDIDEDEDNVKMTVAFLMSKGILTQNNPDEYELLTAHEMTDSECDSAARVRRLRAQKALIEGDKALQCNAAVTGSNATVTTCNVEIDIDKEIDKRDRVREKRKRFTAPTVDEVEAYAKEKGYTGFSAKRFVDYYESKGWVVGKNSPMKDWRASVRSWVARDSEPRQIRPQDNPAQDYAQRDNSTYENFQFTDLSAYGEG